MEEQKEQLARGGAYLVFEFLVVICLYVFTSGWLWLAVKTILLLRTLKEALFWYWDLSDFMSDYKLNKFKD